jgi:biopolymer transport protein ExbB
MEIIVETLKYLQKGGGLLWIIAFISFGILFVFLKNWFQLNRALIPIHDEARLFAEISSGSTWASIKRNFSGADNHFFARAINYCVRRIEQGANIFTVIDELRTRETGAYERDIALLSALVAAAPLLGLLGTVFGMTQTFDAIAFRSADTTELMASGISQALITTKFGLVVALPGIFGVSSLKKKLAQLDVRFLQIEHKLILGLRSRDEKTIKTS